MINNEIDSIFDKIEKRKFDNSCCFLCGEDLNEENRSVEHVFPKWILKKFDLWDANLVMTNGTGIRYRFLTIPCCKKCNNEYLSVLEMKIQKSMNAGFDTFKDLDKQDIFLWIGKIYFGLIYKNLFLDYDVKDKTKGRIFDEEFIKTFKTHWLFLQGIRGKHRFVDFFPASIHVVKTIKYSDIKLQWDYMDTLNSMYISLRMGDIAIFACLQDGEAVKNSKQVDFFKPFTNSDFRSFSCRLIYHLSLLNRIPKFMISSNNSNVLETRMMPLQGLSSKFIFDEWDDNELRRIHEYVFSNR